MAVSANTSNERDRRETEWLAREVALAASLTDADRIRILRDLLRTADAISRSKSPEQLRREEKVRRILEERPGRERYLAWVDRLSDPKHPSWRYFSESRLS